MPKREKHHYQGEPQTEVQAQAEPAKHERPYGVICYWEHRQPAKYRDDKRWFLVEFYGIDHDGYPTGEVKNRGDFADDRHNTAEYINWLTKKEPYDPPHQDEYERGPVPGRVVTLWTIHGVELMGFNPPGEEANSHWLAQEFDKKLKKVPKWWELLERGDDMLAGTERLVEDLMDAEWDFAKVQAERDAKNKSEVSH
jgi:hypothetical protein